MDWYDDNDRYEMVLHGGFYCDEDIIEWAECENCSAKHVCDYYADNHNEENDE